MFCDSVSENEKRAKHAELGDLVMQMIACVAY